jgi:hypothetical protein
MNKLYLYGLAFLMGLLVGLLNWNGNDLELMLLSTILCTFFFGYFIKHRVWSYALVFSFGVPLIHILGNFFGIHEALPPYPNVFILLSVCVPAIIGAYLGKILRRFKGSTK